MYPNDVAANLNAANAAIAMENYPAARFYLDHAGNSAEALYARSVLAALTSDYAAAAVYLDQAEKVGLDANQEDVASLREVIDAALQR